MSKPIFDVHSTIENITDQSTRDFVLQLNQAITSAVSGALTEVERLRVEDPSAFAELLKGLEAART